MAKITKSKFFDRCSFCNAGILKGEKIALVANQIGPIRFSAFCMNCHPKLNGKVYTIREDE